MEAPVCSFHWLFTSCCFMTPVTVFCPELVPPGSKRRGTIATNDGIFKPQQFFGRKERGESEKEENSETFMLEMQ